LSLGGAALANPARKLEREVKVGKREKRWAKYRFSPGKFLDEELIEHNLVLSSLYLFAFEVLKFVILADVEDFLTDTFEMEEASKRWATWEAMLEDMKHRDDRVVAAYRKRLKEFDKNKWKASYLFLADIGVISEEDVADIEEITEHRNAIAHELPRLLTDEHLDVNLDRLMRMREILGKIEAWQMDIEKAISPELEDEELHSFRMIVVDRILSVALSGLSEHGK